MAESCHGMWLRRRQNGVSRAEFVCLFIRVASGRNVLWQLAEPAAESGEHGVGWTAVARGRTLLWRWAEAAAESGAPQSTRALCFGAKIKRAVDTDARRGGGPPCTSSASSFLLPPSRTPAGHQRCRPATASSQRSQRWTVGRACCLSVCGLGCGTPPNAAPTWSRSGWRRTGGEGGSA